VGADVAIDLGAVAQQHEQGDALDVEAARDVRRPASSTASRSTAGDTMRHGPHHGAQKSTSTGIDARTASSNVAAVASTTHGRA
jgi:hypothetical protein